MYILKQKRQIKTLFSREHVQRLWYPIVWSGGSEIKIGITYLLHSNVNHR